MVKASLPYIRTYNLFGRPLVILCEDEGLFVHVERYLAPLETAAVAKGQLIRFFIFMTDREGHILACPEAHMIRITDFRNEGWFHFRRMFSVLVRREASDFDHFHASCVRAPDGQVAIFAGESGSGKTTLLLSLLSRGFTMVCEDLVAISRFDHDIRAFPVGSSVTADAFTLFPWLASQKEDRFLFRNNKEWNWTIDPALRYSVEAPYARLTPTHVFFLERHQHALTTCEALSTEEFLWRLHLACQNRTDYAGMPYAERPASSFALDTHLAKTCRGFRLVNGDLSHTVDRLVEAMGSVSCCDHTTGGLAIPEALAPGLPLEVEPPRHTIEADGVGPSGNNRD